MRCSVPEVVRPVERTATLALRIWMVYRQMSMILD